MLPSKSVTPFLGIGQAALPLVQFSFVSGKAALNEEKVSRAFARFPSTSQVQQGTSTTYYA